jgi:hypothetical protein
MKIAFICGSVEPGRDGVGDYTKYLAAELAGLGFETAILSLTDPFVNDKQTYMQHLEKNSIQVFRIPALWSDKNRFKVAKEWLDKYNPQVISLQFVIYSFHRKGLPFGLNKKLKLLTDGRRLHIMFHELYVGFTKISSLKHRMTGHFQRRIILSIVKSLQPELITTSNHLYQSILSKDNVASQVLPLFSNIAIAPIDENFRLKVLQDIAISKEDLSQYLIAGIFGNIPKESQLEQAIGEQLQYADANDKRLIIIGFGKINNQSAKEFDRLRFQFCEKVRSMHLGPQSDKTISALIQLLDIAISCTPAPHIGKSGVFAAFRLHGAKVIVPEGKLIPEYKADIPKYTQEYLNRPPSDWSVNYVAKQFSYLLKGIHL